jgi:hypothetical protein
MAASEIQMTVPLSQLAFRDIADFLQDRLDAALTTPSYSVSAMSWLCLAFPTAGCSVVCNGHVGCMSGSADNFTKPLSLNVDSRFKLRGADVCLLCPNPLMCVSTKLEAAQSLLGMPRGADRIPIHVRGVSWKLHASLAKIWCFMGGMGRLLQPQLFIQEALLQQLQVQAACTCVLSRHLSLSLARFDSKLTTTCSWGADQALQAATSYFHDWRQHKG